MEMKNQIKVILLIKIKPQIKLNLALKMKPWMRLDFVFQMKPSMKAHKRSTFLTQLYNKKSAYSALNIFP